MKRIFALAFVFCALHSYAAEPQQPRGGSATVTLVRAHDGSGIQMLSLDGDLDEKVIDRLNAFEHLKGKTGVIVYLNSFGGSLKSGLAIGTRIRELGFSTQVGMPTGNFNEVQPGYCESACVFALAGGRFRLAQPESRVGVHQFAMPSKTSSEEALVKAQAGSALTVNYLISMGVDPALFTLMASTPSNSIQLLTVQQQFELRLVNGGREAARWGFQTTKLGGLILVGEQATISTSVRLEIACNDKESVAMAAIFSAGEKTPLITESVTDYRLLLDGKPYPITGKIVRQSGQITRVDFVADQRSVDLGSAQTLGLEAHSSGKNLDFGFAVDTGASRSLIGSFSRLCRGDRPALSESL